MRRISFVLVLLFASHSFAEQGLDPKVEAKIRELKSYWLTLFKPEDREFSCGQDSNAWLPYFSKISKDVWLSRSENCAPISISGQMVVYDAYHKYLSDFSTGTEIIIDTTYLQWLQHGADMDATRTKFVYYNDVPNAFIGTREQLVAFFTKYKDDIQPTAWYYDHESKVDNVEKWVDKTYSLGNLNYTRFQYNGDRVDAQYRQQGVDTKNACDMTPRTISH